MLGGTNVALNGKLFDENECFKYFGSHVVVDAEIDWKSGLQ